ncbi:c6 zinc finger domain containing protein [Grosmannia clavigera kw1407]|uniref:C6 zinc finger domain containing protein n=1 Tax=Grosmannia clavigera (strain kw1407 / UAMH 11150) TaxID=655863 RepID=F0XLF6_GROCL|nr:c6 zinc finger domain containing protein [Grosmannia clavigera kw1407]EFX01266.1 c6 zinc finger domain containing protein [Grosmannia clavigera kw1407]
MSFDYNNAAAGGEAAFIDQFYPYNTSPATTSPMTAAPSNASSAMVSPTNSQQAVAWAMPYDYTTGPVAPVVPSTVQSPIEAAVSSPEDSRHSLSPGHISSVTSSPPQELLSLSPFQNTNANTPAMLTDQALMSFNPFATADYQNSALTYPAAATTTSALDSLTAYHGLPTVTGADAASATQALQWNLGMANWQDFDAAAVVMPAIPTHGLSHQRIGSMTSLGSNSPTGTCIDVHSLGSSGDMGWATVDLFARMDNFPPPGSQHPHDVIFNPSQTLHLRSNSGSSQAQSDGTSFDYGSYEEVSFPPPFSPYSQDSDTCLDGSGNHRNCFHTDVPADHQHQHVHQHQHQHQHRHGNPHQHHSHELISPAAVVAPMPIKAGTTSHPSSNRQSPAAGSGVGSTAASASPPVRRSSGVRKSPTARPSKAVVRRASTGKDGRVGEKKVGRRRGPLLPEQRKQASEIRKLRACLRCKFLKKTCDKGEPCAGCQPSHARLWQVPCTRIDIKDVNYFMKDWKADYSRHLDRGVSVFNVKGFAPKERLMWITHGYGFCLPIMVREVYVADDSCFQIDWVESHLTEQEPIEYDVRTERLDVGQDGISTEKLSEYLDRHIDGTFEHFVDDHFDGTPFVTEILKTAHRYYMKQGQPVIRKALKLVLAYNLTMHITLVEQQGSEEPPMEGQIDDEDSKFYGKVVAPVMINFQIKCAMADMWRELQKEILEELSSLYSSVYSGDRLKNWPTIFMLAAILLIVWEEMQFDCHYRVPDAASVGKFCGDMEGTPVGVVVGLFHAISQKLPAFTDWDTKRHGQVLNNNEAVCEAMTEVRQHIMKHDTYLRARPNNTEFDRYDFDSLSNKFLSKLVIRAN